MDNVNINITFTLSKVGISAIPLRLRLIDMYPCRRTHLHMIADLNSLKVLSYFSGICLGVFVLPAKTPLTDPEDLVNVFGYPRNFDER